MKALQTFLTAALLMLFLLPATAQESEKMKMFLVHEDHVRPGMSDEHEKLDKQLLEAVKKHKVDTRWLALETNNNVVRYVIPIESMADLDENPMGDLKEKMGESEYNSMMDQYDPTYSKHGDYVILLDHNLSYMPEGMTQTPEGEDYRSFITYYPSPENYQDFEQKAGKMKKLFADNNSGLHYRVYRSGFGTIGDYFMVAIAAKDAQHYEQKIADNAEQLGEAFQQELDALLTGLDKVETERAWIRNDLSYNYNQQ